MPTSATDPNSDQLSAEDLEALHHTLQALSQAGDPRAMKLGKYIAAQTPDMATQAMNASGIPGAAPSVASPKQATARTSVQATPEYRFIDSATTAFPNAVVGGAKSALAAVAGNPYDIDNPINQEVVRSVGQGKQTLQDILKMKPGQALLHGLSAIPMVGGMVQQTADQVKAGDVAGGVGSAVGNLAALRAGSELPKGAEVVGDTARELPATVAQGAKAVGRQVLPSLIDPPPEALLTKAVKPGNKNVGWDDAIKSAMPNLKAAEADLGRPVQGINDAIQAVGIAKKQIWGQYEAKLGPNAKYGQIDGNQIADAMVSSIDKRTALQNPELAAKIKQAADTYRRPMSLDEAEEFLQSTNADLSSYYAKNKVGKNAALADPEKAATVAEGDGLRSALYSKLDELAGPGAADIKRQYGALTNVEAEMLNRKNVAARQQPQSLSEQLSTARGYGKIAKGIFTLDAGDIAEGAQNIATSKFLKERNGTDAMIERAFSAYPNQIKEVNPAQQFSPAGLLPSGPVRVGPSSTESPLSSPPPVDATTRAQRLGLLLPEQTAIRLGAGEVNRPFEMLDANSIVVRDPKTGRMRKMFITSGSPQK